MTNLSQAPCLNLSLLKDPKPSYVDQVHDIMYKWSAQWTTEARQGLKDLVWDVENQNTKHWGNLLSIYTNRMFPIQYLPANAPLSLTSGVWCFYGGIFLALVEKKLHVSGESNVAPLQLLTSWTTKTRIHPVIMINRIFNFTLLYVVFDHYMDDHTIGWGDKFNRIKSVHNILLDKNSIIENDELLSTIKQAVNTLDIDIGHRKALLDIFKAEVITALRQNGVNPQLIPQTYQFNFASSTDSMQQLLFMAEWKGGQTVQSMQSILELEPTREGYILGACIQLADDMHDIEEDIKDGISTIATHIYKEKGYVDSLAYYAVYNANLLNQKYAIFKTILIPLVSYTVTVRPYFSPELKQKWAIYSPLPKDNEFNNKLYNMLRILLKKE